jgi:predicted PurR-regulated permease PerM
MAEFGDAIGARVDHPAAIRILMRVDTMLAKYIRAQLALVGLSFAFYSISMTVLRFPYAIALGLLGGILEFLSAVGWIASATTQRFREASFENYGCDSSQ